MPAVDERQAARFAQMWNKIITSFRKEDLVSDRYLNDFLKFFGPWITSYHGMPTPVSYVGWVHVRALYLIRCGCGDTEIFKNQ